jgi:hypothetical protein
MHLFCTVELPKTPLEKLLITLRIVPCFLPTWLFYCIIIQVFCIIFVHFSLLSIYWFIGLFWGDSNCICIHLYTHTYHIYSLLYVHIYNCQHKLICIFYYYDLFQ